MLNDATCKAVYIICGYTDLRVGMDRLAALMGGRTPGTGRMSRTRFFCSAAGVQTASKDLCGKVTDGFCCTRLSESRFQWPRNFQEVRSLTQQQFRWLMEGLTITPKKSKR